MKFEPFIAYRVAFSENKTFTKMIIRIAIVAVALSLAIMIIATALIQGFKKEISEKVFGFWGHIHITDTYVNRSIEAVPIDMNQAFYPSIDSINQVYYPDHKRFLGFKMGDQEVDRVTKGGVQRIQSFTHLPGIINTKKEFEGIILKGVGLDFDWSFIQEYLVEGTGLNLVDSVQSNGIIISKQTSNRLNLNLADEFLIHFVINGNQLKRKFKIAGIFKTGLEEYDKQFAIIDMRKIQQLLGWSENQVGGFEVFVENLDDIDKINEYIYLEELPANLYSESIRSKFPQIFEWLELQNINESTILALMIIVSIINMITALLILILERTKMIGILKSLGARDWKIRNIFLIQAAYIIMIGLFFSNLFGIGICWLQKQFEFISLNEANYYLSVAPIHFDFMTILILNVATLFIILLTLIIPTYLVSKITPMKSLRFD